MSATTGVPEKVPSSPSSLLVDSGARAARPDEEEDDDGNDADADDDAPATAGDELLDEAGVNSIFPFRPDSSSLFGSSNGNGSKVSSHS